MNYDAFDRHKPHWLNQKEVHYSYAQFNMKALRNESLLALFSHELQFVDRGVHNRNITETNIICVCGQIRIYISLIIKYTDFCAGVYNDVLMAYNTQHRKTG